MCHGADIARDDIAVTTNHERNMGFNAVRAAAGVAIIATAHVLSAQQAPGVKVAEESPGLLARAKVAPDSATRLAQAKVPKGTIESAEIEQEDGRLIYSFNMRVPGKPGVEEVAVDAIRGKVLSVEHESDAAIAKEKAADSARKVKAKSKG
jgi:uncharacterized membrane protein YkoI